MTTITKLECNGCGASLEIIPGVDRITCKSCGSSFWVKHDTTRYSNSPQLCDNPANVILERNSINCIELTAFDDYDHQESQWIRSPECVLETKEYNPGNIYQAFLKGRSIQKFHNGIEHRLQRFKNDLSFVSALALLSDESYDLLIARAFINGHWEDCVNNEIPVFGRLISDSEIKPLIKGDMYAELALDFTDKFIKKYSLSHEDKLKYSVPQNGKAFKYLERLLSMKLGKNSAETILGNDGADKLSKVASFEFLKDIAAKVYGDLNVHQNLQLSEHRVLPASISVENDSIVWKYCTAVYNQVGTVGRSTRVPYFSDRRVYFKEYGMKDIDNETIKGFVLSSVLSQINRIAKYNNTPRWGISKIEYRCLKLGSLKTNCHLVCEFQTKALYKDWL